MTVIRGSRNIQIFTEVKRKDKLLIQSTYILKDNCNKKENSEIFTVRWQKIGGRKPTVRPMIRLRPNENVINREEITAKFRRKVKTESF